MTVPSPIACRTSTTFGCAVRGLVALVALGPPLALAPASAQEKPTLTTEDYGQWERLGQATLSDDGRWLAAAISRVNEEDELRVRPVANPDSVVAVLYGSRPAFSSDGPWLAVSIGMSDDARSLRPGGRRDGHGGP